MFGPRDSTIECLGDMLTADVKEAEQAMRPYKKRFSAVIRTPRKSLKLVVPTISRLHKYKVLYGKRSLNFRRD